VKDFLKSSPGEGALPAYRFQFGVIGIGVCFKLFIIVSVDVFSNGLCWVYGIHVIGVRARFPIWMEGIRPFYPCPSRPEQWPIPFRTRQWWSFWTGMAVLF